jgi:hypothetical protein
VAQEGLAGIGLLTPHLNASNDPISAW